MHTWIATKEKGASGRTVHQVLGWHHRRGRSAAAPPAPGTPDRTWFNSPPQLLAGRRGTAAEALIAEVHSAVERCPMPTNTGCGPAPTATRSPPRWHGKYRAAA
ncbi:MAG: DUF3750 domain-containing protein [Arhodomonas sp.]|nr:DUF3750 domain-containing protein [Arhodomonas sp.]